MGAPPQVNQGEPTPIPSQFGLLMHIICMTKNLPRLKSCVKETPWIRLEIPRTDNRIQKCTQYVPGWWLTYPSEKYETSQLGWLFLIYGKSSKCSKPPTRSTICPQVLQYTLKLHDQPDPSRWLVDTDAIWPTRRVWTCWVLVDMNGIWYLFSWCFLQMILSVILWHCDLLSRLNFWDMSE